jgi:uncharacterized protein YegJ (DUF2314 family)
MVTPNVFKNIISVWLLAAFLVSCGNDERKVGDVVERDGEPPIQYVDNDDPKMNAAIEKARSTADQFIAALAKPKKSQSSFTVKYRVADGDDGEHMWIDPVMFKDGKFHGKLANEPDIVKTVKLNDDVSVAKEDISDWMYVDDGTLVGGFTLRAIRDSLTPKKQIEFDKGLPFKID